jgi:hypothetical protein
VNGPGWNSGRSRAVIFGKACQCGPDASERGYWRQKPNYIPHSDYLKGGNDRFIHELIVILINSKNTFVMFFNIFNN